MRKIFGKFLAAGLCIAMALSSVTVKADSVDQKYLALGADLTASQKKKVLELLNLDDNSDYKVITVTNKDEHEYLDSYLSKSVIGTRALSSVTVEQRMCVRVGLNGPVKGFEYKRIVVALTDRIGHDASVTEV